MVARESDIQRVWSGVLEAERHYRYYDTLKGRISLVHNALAFIIIAGSLGAVVSLLTPCSQCIKHRPSPRGSVVSVFLFVTNYGARAVTARIVAHQYSILASEWKRLWRGINDGSPDLVSLRASVLERMQTAVDGHADQCGGTNAKLNVRVTTDAYWVVVDEFGN